MNNQRESFEKFWAVAHSKDSLKLIDNEIAGIVFWDYVFPKTRCAWEIWKASQADQAKTIEQLGFNALDFSEFTQAVIEDYKASLVPVAYVDKNSSGQISLKTHYSDYFDMSKFVGVSLYALGETN